jgi:hypothetical protein
VLAFMLTGQPTAGIMTDVGCMTADCQIHFHVAHPVILGRDSSVGIATRYGLDCPGSNPCEDEIFRTRPDRSCGPHSLLYSG